jgi:alcohol oxidase
MRVLITTPGGGSLSLCPDNLGTNTYSSALLCGEKCAQIIADEMSLQFKIPHVPEEMRI